MFNFFLKLACFTVFGLLVWKAISLYLRERGRSDAKHILWWTTCVFSTAIFGIPGEYALQHNLMIPPIHVLYDAIIDSLLLGAIYHGVAFTAEMTQKNSCTRFTKGYLLLAWGFFTFFHACYRFGLPVLFYYVYYALRIVVIAYYVGKIIYWFHRASKETDTFHTYYQMTVLKYACIVSTLYPFSLLPGIDEMNPRPNIIVGLISGILLYLGFAMPGWFERILIRFRLNSHLLDQLLWLTGYISEYYQRITPVLPTRLEHTLKGFCQSLGLRRSQINLLVKASYLINIGGLYYDREKTLSAPGDWNTKVDLSTQVTGEILQFSKIAEILRHVTERWDGSGHPDELKEEEIPLESRILAVVNFFVCSSEEKGVKETLFLLKEESGKKFDPKIVEKFEFFCKKNQPSLD